MHTATLEPVSEVARHDAPLTMPAAAERLGVRLDRFRMLLTRHHHRVAGLLVQVGHLRCVEPRRLPELRSALGLPPE